MEDIEGIKDVLLQHGYDSVKLLGSGAYSNVFLCHSIKYNDTFAIKRIAQKTITYLEYDALISLNNPYIIKLYEAFDHGEYSYLVMEYCSNGNLKEKGKLDKESFITYSKQMLEALHVCHSKMIAHRDIKPENIFIDKYNRVKLADFGFARKFDTVEASNEKCGSLMYAAPEIFKSMYINPFQTDIWSLGATFFYMITGEFPYKYANFDELKQAVMKGEINYNLIDDDYKIRSLIIKMTSYTPENRPTPDALLHHPLYMEKRTIIIPKAVSYYTLKKYSSGAKVKTESPKYMSDKSTTESNTSDDQEHVVIPIKKIHAYKSVIRIPKVKPMKPI